MPFAEEVRAELCESLPGTDHCRAALLAGIVRHAGAFHLRDGEVSISCDVASSAVARRVVQLARRLGATCEVRTYHERRFGRRSRFVILLGADARSLQVLHEVGVLAPSLAPAEEVPRRIVARSCCRRSYLRGAFLAAGSIASPRSAAHLEIRCASAESAAELARLAGEEAYELAVHDGHRYAVAYAKRAEAVRDLLAGMGAHGAELRLEEEDVLKSVRERANRLTNADAANLRRQTGAAARQLAAIEELGGPDALPPDLRVVALLRVAHPEAALGELGELAHPPLTKAAVAGRLRRLVQRAEG